jgi:CheY-like chemotaxis protein
MDNRIIDKTARIAIVETVATRRTLLADILRGLGFSGLATLNRPEDLLSHLKASPVDWIIMPLCTDFTVNAMHILKILATHKELRGIRVSLLVAQEEKLHIPFAFELGALSYHSVPYNRETMNKALELLFKRFTIYNGNETLVAAEYLRQSLIELRMPKLRLDLELALNETYTAEPVVLMHLAKAQQASNENEAAVQTLKHIKLISKEFSSEVDKLISEFGDHQPTSRESNSVLKENESDDINQKSNLLGLKSCVIIDPDTKVQYIAETLLKDAGVSNVQLFEDGSLAWDSISKNPEPDLVILEWSLKGIAGPLLLQRIRQKGFLRVPVIVVSSTVTPDDLTLLQEMGVSVVVEKPFDQESFFKRLVSVLRQDRRPTEQLSLEIKIRQLLATENHAEAYRLWQQYKSDDRIPTKAQRHLEAEFLFFEGQYEDACDFASQALNETRDSLPLLNLLGRCLLKLGRYEVALKCFARAQEISPNNVARLCGMAEMQHFIGDEKSADKSLESAKSIDASSNIVKETTANIALSRGDVKQASKQMTTLESLQGVLAFMNNRAIALIRTGQFDEGIELYRNTIMALPGQWSHIHNVVTYNLGLAHARYGEIEKSMDALKRIAEKQRSTLTRKRDSLLFRLAEAKKNGGALVLNESEESSEIKSSKTLENLNEFVDVRRGDICCYLLFQMGQAVDPTSLALLEHLPMFIKKTENQKSKKHNKAKPMVA